MNEWLSEAMTTFESLHIATLPPVYKVLLITVTAMVLNMSVRRVISTSAERYKSRQKGSEKVKRVDTLTRVCQSAISIFIWLVAGTIALGSLGFSIAPILTTAGVSGIAIGLATQNLVKDYFSGFIILLEGQIRVGDIVELGGAIGEVEEMTLRYVRLRNLSGDVIFVPNGNITNVTNKSLQFSFALIDVGIAYREDVDEVLQIMRETSQAMQSAPEFKGVILDDMEIMGVNDWADSSVVLRGRIKVKAGKQWDVRRAYLRQLKYAFDKSAIEIPYPHLTLYAGQLKDGSAPPFHIFHD